MNEVERAARALVLAPDAAKMDALRSALEQLDRDRVEADRMDSLRRVWRVGNDTFLRNRLLHICRESVDPAGMKHADVGEAPFDYGLDGVVCIACGATLPIEDARKIYNHGTYGS